MGLRTTTFVSIGVVVPKTSERLEAVLGRRLFDYEGIDKDSIYKVYISGPMVGKKQIRIVLGNLGCVRFRHIQ